LQFRNLCSQVVLKRGCPLFIQRKPTHRLSRPQTHNHTGHLVRDTVAYLAVVDKGGAHEAPLSMRRSLCRVQQTRGVLASRGPLDPPLFILRSNSPSSPPIGCFNHR
jgi:hypothetical protein